MQKNQSLDDFKEIAVTDGKEKSVQLVAPQNITSVVPYATDGSADTKSLTVKFSKKKQPQLKQL
ncbi:D-alanyl-D-alanine carboxypeptidase [Lactococcus cremoris]|uniref:D-alanyl-D-alanine carboxypeptidase n=1 Tax=Lactococcus lactis subsp. cremoris TaxID=1359 RepID=UPI002413D6B4|nr:D-alanyl-D-alanine carboxypeptidase [Lactococcus cremoris]WKD56527.1 D-alanyl-D-alanine carboxypeptidase [Lactococcus cremoris]